MSAMTRLSCILALILAALRLAPEALAQDIEVTPGTPVSFSLPAGAFADGFYVDVPAEVTQLTIALDAVDNPALDVDLLVRYGSPFQYSPGQPADPSALFNQAQYRSASSAGAETLTLLRQGRLPLREGRWYLSALNFVNSAVNVRLTVTTSTSNQLPYVPISVDFTGNVVNGEDACDVSPWNDSTSRSPTGGNPGTTLGQQRRNAMLKAAELLSEDLRPTVPIMIRACWDNLGTGNAITLAQASSTYLFLDDPGINSHMPFLDARFSYFSTPASARQSGTNLCRFAGGPCNAADVHATFNDTVDGPDSLGSFGFYYGYDGNRGGNTDFVSVAMHEITHGLGFYGLISAGPTDDNPDAPNLGERYTDYADAFDNHVRWVSSSTDPGSPILDISDSQRANALTSGGGLRFAGPHVLASDRNPLGANTAPANFPQLYAPFTSAPGSTLSHFNTNLINQLMGPFASGSIHTLGLARDVLFDVGWEPDVPAVTSYPRPPSAMLYDPAHSGHGINFLRVPGLDDFYFLVFYTYEADGSPEFYVSSGYLIDGIFAPPRGDTNGDSLARPVYVAGDPNPIQVDNSPDFDGQIVLDFNSAAESPACRDGYPGRALDGELAVMTWTLNDESAQWCMQPIEVPLPAQGNFSNLWNNATDPGWGLFSLSFGNGDHDGAALILYYPDGNGHGRWAIQQLGEFVPGDTYPLLQLDGYCRLCEKPEGTLPSSEIGQIGASLYDPGNPSAVEGGSFAPAHIQMTADFGGDAGLRFSRDTDSTPAIEWGPVGD